VAGSSSVTFTYPYDFHSHWLVVCRVCTFEFAAGLLAGLRYTFSKLVERRVHLTPPSDSTAGPTTGGSGWGNKLQY
jgi:hypothetical protein